MSDGGGSVCFCVKSGINFSVCNDLDTADLENLYIEVRNSHSKPLIVVSWYRPPNYPVRLYSHLEKLIGKLDLTNFDFFLLGNVNAWLLPNLTTMLKTTRQPNVSFIIDKASSRRKILKIGFLCMLIGSEV